MIEQLKPTKPKIYGFLVLIAGYLIPNILWFFIYIYYSRIMGPEGYQNFINSLQTNYFLSITLFVLGIIWFYILASIIVNISKRK